MSTPRARAVGAIPSVLMLAPAPSWRLRSVRLLAGAPDAAPLSGAVVSMGASCFSVDVPRARAATAA